MKVAVIGSGFVGLTHAAVLAERRHHVVACEVDEDKLTAYRSGRPDEIERYVNEPGLSSSIRDSLARGRLSFTCDLRPHVDEIEAVFLALPTPPTRTGATDLRCYLGAVRDLAALLAERRSAHRVVVVNKSTVPIGTARRLANELEVAGARNVGVASNPEFLPQGNAVEASRKPDRVVVGADTDADFALLRELYAPYVDHVRIRYLETTPETAEAIKYVANALLFTYISFWNGVAARLAETAPGIRMSDLRRGVTADARISTWGSYVGNGAGGSCFGKDIRSLIHQLTERGQETAILRAVLEINEYQKCYLIERAATELDFQFNQKTVAVLGLAFKKNTNDLRDSSAVRVIDALLARGTVSVRAYDPLIDRESAAVRLDPRYNHLYRRIDYFASAEEAIAGSDALFISSDAEEFRALAPIIERSVRPPYLILDGRRMIDGDRDRLIDAGYSYLAVGGAVQGRLLALAGEGEAA